MVSTPRNPRFNPTRGSNQGSALSISRPKNLDLARLFDAQQQSRQELRNAERSASRSLDQFSPQSYRNRDSFDGASENAVSSARAGEGATSGYTNNVTGKSRFEAKGKQKKSKFRRFGPLAFIVALIAGGGLFFSTSFSFLGPQLISVVTQQTDVQYPSYNLRNQRLLKYMMGDVKISNFTRKYTNFSPWLKSRLAKNGIEVGKIDASGNFTPGSTISTSSTVLKYGDDIITANDFQSRFASDVNFREAYYDAKRGRVAGFFDDAADRFYTKRNQTRDIFSRYTTTGDSERDRSNFNDIIDDHFTGADTSVSSGMRTIDPETGEEQKVKNGSDVNSGKVAGDTPEAKARAFVNSLSGIVETAGVPACSALRIVNIASVAAMAYAIAQSVSYFLSFVEPINKAMAGDGDTASAHEALNFLNQSTDNEITYVDEHGEQQTKTVSGSPLDSYGARLMLSNTNVNQADVDPFGINNLTRSATRVAATAGITTSMCTGVQAASAIVSIASIAVPGGSIAKVAIGLVAKTVGGIALTGIIAAIVNVIVPQLTKLFISSAFEYYTGIPGGEFLFEGATNSNYGLATEGAAAMPASQARVARQNYETRLAVAQEAQVDRLNRSPFDASSPNTFLGSLVRQMSAVTYSTNFMNASTAFMGNVHKSLGSILAGAYADEVSSIEFTSVTQECEFLPGAVCDIYGTPIPAADYSTIDIAPDDATYEAIISQNLDFTGSAKNRVTTATPGNNTNSDGTMQYGKYPLSDGQLRGLIAVAEKENGSSLTAVKTELSFMANLYEHKRSAPYTADGLVDYILNGGWFANSSTSAYDENHTPSYNGALDAAKDIFNNGKRTIPKQIIEHDCIYCGSGSYDITSASNDGVQFDVNDRSKYKQNKTVITNRYGSTYVFYQWADPETGEGDPFGYAVGDKPDELVPSESSEDEVSNVTKTFSDYKIRDDSELAKFINFCVNRESPWGVTDANILNALQSDDIELNSMPIFNDFLDILNAYEDKKNEGWATGSICMNSEDNPRWESEFKYYQRYIEDMRILGTMSNETDNANPVIAYEKSYDETHPIDTTFEGTLARISGLTRDDVAFLMEVVDYSNELAEYDPTTRYGYEAKEEKTYEMPEKTIFDTVKDFVAVYPTSYSIFGGKEVTTSC